MEQKYQLSATTTSQDDADYATVMLNDMYNSQAENGRSHEWQSNGNGNARQTTDGKERSRSSQINLY